MATPNKGLEQPARGSLVGVWDTPVNANMDVIDSAFGGVSFVALTNSNVILSSGQYRNQFLTFTGALSATVSITFPVVGSVYTIQNLTTNTSAFQVILTTSNAGLLSVGCPWNDPFQVMVDTSGGLKFIGLDRVGAYWDYAGSSMPAWVSACTIPPYLECNGATFSSAAYPNLTRILGNNTLPDARGRYRATVNQGTGRITSGSSTGGVDGDNLKSAGGSQTTTLSAVNMPLQTVNIFDPGHSHTINRNNGVVVATDGLAVNGFRDAGTFGGIIGNNPTGITANVGNASPNNVSNLPPTYVGGITLVRAG